ncbi:MAG: transglutaminase-like domain-containing protein [Peptococcaceae bacterium]|nr:transglutaminase-like domain-containing protein [Peptococcaceae bacterium]
MNKGIFSLIILLLFTGLWVASSRIHANTAADYSDRFSLYKDPEEMTTFLISGKTLLLRDLPKSDNFKYILLFLSDDHKSIPMQTFKTKRKEGRDVRISLRNVPNGLYTVEIYYGSARYSSYAGYICGQSLQIEIRDSSAVFIEPLPLTKNREIFAANVVDIAALAPYTKPSAKVESDEDRLIQHAMSITSGATSDYDKAKTVYDWVSQNIQYDYDALYSGIYVEKSALETLASGRGVCIDYASLTAALLRAVNVPTKLVTGYLLDTSAQEVWTEELIAADKGNHVWNEAFIDGRWIIIDTSYEANDAYRKYFDISIEFLSSGRVMLPKHLDPLRFR